ncbi:MAG: histidine phosphotransferase family protein [Ascidiaceihabitans sp.]|jgi:histidine phosphotransferase ChpT|nr:histidine phosphotransferase family protein [Ascidiaceihabitans sp.]
MAQNDLELAALVSSRICHDLISPIGAINNGLELLNMSGASPVGPEMQLICDSVKSVSARIRFFRIAFDAASDDPVVRNEVTSILTEMFDGGRLAVQWGPVDIQTRKAVRCAFLTILCLETAMPFGGQIRVSSSLSSWEIVGKSDKFSNIDVLWNESSLSNTSAKMSPTHVQFSMLRTAANDEDVDLRLKRSPKEISILF